MYFSHMPIKHTVHLRDEKGKIEEYSIVDESGLLIVGDENGRVREVIRTKKGSTLADAVAAGIILRGTLQNLRYEENKETLNSK